MGLYEGGLLMTLLFITIVAFFSVTGVLAERNPSAINSISCIPNDKNISQYGGLPSGTIGTSNCQTDTNASNTNISSTQNDNSDVTSGVLSLVGLGSLTQVPRLLGLMIGGWVIILEIILGGGPLSFLIFLIGVPLQILQIYFLVQVILQIVGALRGVAQPR